MLVTITASKTSPYVTFTMTADLASQSIDGNYSRIVAYLKASKGSSSYYGGAGTQIGSIDGVGEFGRRSADPFLPSGSTGWSIGPFYLNVPHNVDGSRAPVTIRMSLDYGNINSAHTATLSLPTIPRASKPTFEPSSTFDAGAPVQIQTHRASTAFTHDITYTFGSQTGTVVTGLPTDYDWTPPLSLLTEIPNATSGAGHITTVTKNGSTVVGTVTTPFTLRVPASVVPSVSSITVTDQNPNVASIVGKFVQSLSRAKMTVNAAGIYGSTISSATATLQGATVASGGEVTVTQSGTLTVTAKATDSRGRTGSGSGSISVLPYVAPSVSSYQARRCNSIGSLLDDGTYLRVDLTAAIKSLVNGTERNALTIRAFTKPRGSGLWTARNVITPGGLSYASWFLMSGGGGFDTLSSWDVRVQVQDKFGTYTADTVVSTASVALDMVGTKVGVGKIWEQGALDVAGDIHAADLHVGNVYQNGSRVVSLSTIDSDLPVGLRASAVAISDIDVSRGTGTYIYTPSLAAGTRPPDTYGSMAYGIVREVIAGNQTSQTATPWTSPTPIWYRVKTSGGSWGAWRIVDIPRTAPGPFGEARGQVSCAASGVTTVTLPSGRFSVAPNIQATPVGNGTVGIAHISQRTTTSFEVRFFQYNGVQASGVIDWVASQATSGSAGG